MYDFSNASSQDLSHQKVRHTDHVAQNKIYSEKQTARQTAVFRLATFVLTFFGPNGRDM
jgi:hypothetical protein